MATTILILVLCSSWLLVWVQLSQNRSRRKSTFRISRRTSFWPNKCLIVVRAEVNSSLKRRQLSSFFFFSWHFLFDISLQKPHVYFLLLIANERNELLPSVICGCRMYCYCEKKPFLWLFPFLSVSQKCTHFYSTGGDSGEGHYFLKFMSHQHFWGRFWLKIKTLWFSELYKVKQ